MITEEQGAVNAAAELPTSQFTAINRKEQPTTAVSNGVNGNSRRRSDERFNGRPRTSPSGQEKLTITTTISRDLVASANRDWQSSQPAPSNSDAESFHRRKRSGSAERDSSSAESYHSQALHFSTKQTPTTATSESYSTREDLREQQQSGPRDPRVLVHQSKQFIASANDRRETAVGDVWRAGQDTQQTSGQQLGEVWQRAFQGVDALQRNCSNTCPASNDRSANPYGLDRTKKLVQSDLQQRKKQFSNRTKTGCMTCRRRKKKCDETRPECANCVRCGFICTGYQQQIRWPQIERKLASVPLPRIEYESSGYAQSSCTIHHMGPSSEHGYRGQPLRIDPKHGRPLGIEDDDSSGSTMPSALVTSSENNRLSAISYAHQAPIPISASSCSYPDLQLKNAYERVGPLHDLSRQEPSQDSEGGKPQSAHTYLQTPSEPPYSSLQVSEQLAVSNLASASRQRTQKEEMLASRPYLPFDKELVLERERCSRACWRFNNSMNPNNGVSPEERARLFRNILQPREHVIPLTQGSLVSTVSRVGDNPVIKSPFNCDYGYNISIGEDVEIGSGCTILDACEVEIGNRCNIGPNVNIYTTTPLVDSERLGSRGPNLGKKVTIDPDCWIGGGVTILPGRSIGQGSTVGAGSIVTRDVPPYTVVCGNPARVIRGVYPSHES